MNYKELKSLAKHQTQSFGRIVKCEMYILEDGFLAVTGMHDDFHDINLAVYLDDRYTVKDIAADMERIPYPACEVVPPESLKKLISLPVFEKGVMKSVREIVPRKEGCTHLYEMIESTFRSIFVGLYNIMGAEYEGALELDPEEERQHHMSSPILRDTCYAFSSESEDLQVLASALAKVRDAKMAARKIKKIKKGKS